MATEDENQNGNIDINKIIQDALNKSGTYGTVPAGSVSPSSRSAIGVEGTKTYDPLTGKETGYYGYMGEKTRYYGVQEYPDTVSVQPKYFSGDEDMINAMSAEQVAELQYNLYQAGSLGKNYTPGIVDNSTRSAFREVLGVANRQSTDWVAALKTIKSAVAAQPGDLPTYRLSNPQDLKAVFNKAAQEMLGRTLSDADMNDLVSTFQQRELRAQQQARSGGTVTQAPEAGTFVEKKLTSQFGSEVNVRNMSDIFAGIDQALSGGK
jgi:hypothetical protein